MMINTLFHPHSVGGAAKSVQLLAEGLVKADHEPVIVTLATKDEVQMLNGIKVYYMSHSNIYWLKDAHRVNGMKKKLWHLVDVFNPFIYFKLKRIVKQEQPDIIHTNNMSGFSTAPWMVAKSDNIPVIHTLRDYNLLCPKSTMFKDGENCTSRCTECKLLTQVKQKFSKSQTVQMVVGISDFIKDQHVKEGFFPETPARCIYNGVDTGKVDTELLLRDEPLNRRVKFLYMGRIEKTKGVEPLLDTFRRLPEAELTLAGTIHDLDIRQQVERGQFPTNIQFAGYVDPDEEIPKHDVLIVPSLWHEPFGRVVIEAYAYGKPVIGSKRGGITELIKDKQTGFLFEPADPNSLHSVLIEILNNPGMLADMSYHAKRAVKEFSTENTTCEYEKLYHHIM